MSKLDELICEFCSNGVETVKIKNAFQRLKGTPITAARMKEINNPEGEIKVFAGGKTVITAKEKDIPNANIIRVPAVLVQSRGVIDVIYYDKPFTFKNEMWAYTTSDSTTVKYLFYVLKNNVQRFRDAASGMGSLPQISLPVTEEFEIPLPPIEVQREIVRILDDYTENVVELQNQLALEITARQRQYTFYRNKLLTFSGNEKAKIVKISLGDIGPICMCKRILKSQTNTVEGVPFYKIGTFGKKADAYISKETFDEYRSKYSFPKKGDVLISAAGTIGRTVVYDGKPAYFQDSNIVWIDNDESIVLNSYLRYCYELKPWKVSSGGTIQRLYNDNIAKAIITVPPLDVQNRIVNVLDNFEKICSDLNIGLPAEIEARQKQYEYYRDKLLTFAETGNTILSRAEQSRAEQSRAEQGTD